MTGRTGRGGQGADQPAARPRRERVPQQKPLSAMANNTDFEQIQCLQ